jgi:hypothetical protein
MKNRRKLTKPEEISYIGKPDRHGELLIIALSDGYDRFRAGISIVGIRWARPI